MLERLDNKDTSCRSFHKTSSPTLHFRKAARSCFEFERNFCPVAKVSSKSIPSRTSPLKRSSLDTRKVWNLSCPRNDQDPERSRPSAPRIRGPLFESPALHHLSTILNKPRVPHPPSFSTDMCFLTLLTWQKCGHHTTTTEPCARAQARNPPTLCTSVHAPKATTLPGVCPDQTRHSQPQSQGRTAVHVQTY